MKFGRLKISKTKKNEMFLFILHLILKFRTSLHNHYNSCICPAQRQERTFLRSNFLYRKEKTFDHGAQSYDVKQRCFTTQNIALRYAQVNNIEKSWFTLGYAFSMFLYRASPSRSFDVKKEQGEIKYMQPHMKYYNLFLFYILCHLSLQIR